MNFAPTTDDIIDKGFGRVIANRQVNGIVIHHVAGTGGRDYVANANSRNSHPTYHIANDGTVTGIVNPARRPSSTAHSVDDEAVTVEIANSSVGGDWPISDAAFVALIEIIRYHESKSSRNGFALNIRGKNQPEFFIAWHNQYVSSTACPGPYIIRRLPWLLEALKGSSNSVTSPASPVAPKPAPKPVEKFVRAPGGESNAPMWPKGPLMARIQRGLSYRGRYNYPDGRPRPADGDGASFTAKGIQTTLNVSGTNGGKVTGFRPTPVDGKLGRNNALGVQWYGEKFGGYRGPHDADPLGNSWVAFAIGLETD